MAELTTDLKNSFQPELCSQFQEDCSFKNLPDEVIRQILGLILQIFSFLNYFII